MYRPKYLYVITCKINYDGENIPYGIPYEYTYSQIFDTFYNTLHSIYFVYVGNKITFNQFIKNCISDIHLVIIPLNGMLKNIDHIDISYQIKNDKFIKLNSNIHYLTSKRLNKIILTEACAYDDNEKSKNVSYNMCNCKIVFETDKNIKYDNCRTIIISRNIILFDNAIELKRYFNDNINLQTKETLYDFLLSLIDSICDTGSINFRLQDNVKTSSESIYFSEDDCKLYGKYKFTIECIGEHMHDSLFDYKYLK